MKQSRKITVVLTENFANKSKGHEMPLNPALAIELVNRGVAEYADGRAVKAEPAKETKLKKEKK
jgi:hypothetical protein